MKTIEKKKYVNPSMEVVELKMQQFLMMSNLGSTDENHGNLSREDDYDY